jgi:hypothetical protein
VPDNFRNKLIDIFANLKLLEKLKINIVSSSLNDLTFFRLPNANIAIKTFSLKLSRISIQAENFDNLDFRKSQIENLSLRLEKLNINMMKSILPLKLKQLSIGMIDHIFFDELTVLASDFISKLNNLKLSFIPIYDENYESAFKNILTLLEVCKNVKLIHLENFVLKYKHIIDSELKNVIANNAKLRKLVILSQTPFYVQYINGFYFFEYPKFLVESILYVFKTNKTFSKLYLKRPILEKIFDFQRVKKEKEVCISYKI